MASGILLKMRKAAHDEGFAEGVAALGEEMLYSIWAHPDFKGDLDEAESIVEMAKESLKEKMQGVKEYAKKVRDDRKD